MGIFSFINKLSGSTNTKKFDSEPIIKKLYTIVIFDHMEYNIGDKEKASAIVLTKNKNLYLAQSLYLSLSKEFLSEKDVSKREMKRKLANQAYDVFAEIFNETFPLGVSYDSLYRENEKGEFVNIEGNKMKTIFVS